MLGFGKEMRGKKMYFYVKLGGAPLNTLRANQRAQMCSLVPTPA